ncbi:MAG TPA: RnfH family protein [Noviherbaspirillum sp.]|uniref:RnfH family protein n=1 Tax=Noviherbaspirillum sp. TaxID=1926288 RepID=UPI002D70D3B3|nr:RnfH family protein [Noviherbaspirillum sp.]HYD95737.1 RnfH family protein [Noviherbaspirillum sp.]
MAEIRVQVCYARPDRQVLRELTVAEGATVEAAIRASGLLQEAPEIDLARNRVGIYGKLKALDTVLRAHDRVEIYRPLVADPKESRRARAAKKEEQKAQ